MSNIVSGCKIAEYQDEFAQGIYASLFLLPGGRILGRVIGISRCKIFGHTQFYCLDSNKILNLPII